MALSQPPQRTRKVLRMRTINPKSHVRIMPRSGRRGAIALLTFFLLKNKSETKTKTKIAQPWYFTAVDQKAVAVNGKEPEISSV